MTAVPTTMPSVSKADLDAIPVRISHPKWREDAIIALRRDGILKRILRAA